MQRPWRCDPIVTLWRDGFFVVVSSRWARVAGSRRALRDKSSVRDQLNMPVYKVNCPSINYYSLVIIPDKQAPSGREIYPPPIIPPTPPQPSKRYCPHTPGYAALETHAQKSHEPQAAPRAASAVSCAQNSAATPYPCPPAA
jgi:hypothetical protein